MRKVNKTLWTLQDLRKQFSDAYDQSYRSSELDIFNHKLERLMDLAIDIYEDYLKE